MATPTATVKNEAAERLHHLLDRWVSPATSRSLQAALDAALDAERRATVERIRTGFDFDPCHECENADRAFAILDAEAAR